MEIANGRERTYEHHHQNMNIFDNSIDQFNNCAPPESSSFLLLRLLLLLLSFEQLNFIAHIPTSSTKQYIYSGCENGSYRIGGAWLRFLCGPLNFAPITTRMADGFIGNDFN